MPQQVREPLKAANPLNKQDIQINHYRMPDGDNDGMTANVDLHKLGPNSDRDKHYKVVSTGKGAIPAMVCKSCNEKSSITSNQGIVNEIKR